MQALIMLNAYHSINANHQINLPCKYLFCIRKHYTNITESEFWRVVGADELVKCQYNWCIVYCLHLRSGLNRTFHVIRVVSNSILHFQRLLHADTDILHILHTTGICNWSVFLIVISTLLLTLQNYVWYVKLMNDCVA